MRRRTIVETIRIKIDSIKHKIIRIRENRTLLRIREFW